MLMADRTVKHSQTDRLYSLVTENENKRKNKINLKNNNNNVHII